MGSTWWRSMSMTVMPRLALMASWGAGCTYNQYNEKQKPFTFDAKPEPYFPAPSQAD